MQPHDGSTIDHLRSSAVVLLVLAWGSTFAAVKIGLDSAPPMLFGGLRSMLGGAVMVVLAFARSGRPALRETWPAYAVLTLLNVVLFFSLQTLAILELPSGLAAVLIYLQPVLVGVLAAPLLGESLTGSKIAGLLLGFAGIVVVSAGAFSGHVSAARRRVRRGGRAGLGARHDRVQAVRRPGRRLVGGGDPVPGGRGRADRRAAPPSRAPRSTGPASSCVAFVYAALVGTALSWSLWFGLVGSGEAGRAASYIFFVPLVSLVIGAVFLHETLGPSLLAGAALVILGVYLVNRRPPVPLNSPMQHRTRRTRWTSTWTPPTRWPRSSPPARPTGWTSTPKSGPDLLTSRQLGTDSRPIDAMFVARDGDRVVGEGTVDLPWRDNTDTAGVRVRVHPDVRGRGLGRDLWQQALDFVDAGGPHPRAGRRLGGHPRRRRPRALGPDPHRASA